MGGCWVIVLLIESEVPRKSKLQACISHAAAI